MEPLTEPVVSVTATPAETNRALLIVSCAVLLASSTWFSGTAAAPRIVHDWGLDASVAVILSWSVQVGLPVVGLGVDAGGPMVARVSARMGLLRGCRLGTVFGAGDALLSAGVYRHHADGQNGAGFTISVITIQWLPLLAEQVGWQWAFMALAPGPLIGAFFMWRLGGDASA